MIWIAAVAIGYLLGSIPFGLLLTRAAGMGDIRSIGSGNIGTDLMIKVIRTAKHLEMGAMVGIDAESDGVDDRHLLAAGRLIDECRRTPGLVVTIDDAVSVGHASCDHPVPVVALEGPALDLSEQAVLDG